MDLSDIEYSRRVWDTAEELAKVTNPALWATLVTSYGNDAIAALSTPFNKTMRKKWNNYVKKMEAAAHLAIKWRIEGILDGICMAKDPDGEDLDDYLKRRGYVS